MSAYPISIKGVLRAPTGEIVLLLNERREWELPGGRLERGESPAECLAREMAVALSLQIEVGAPIDTYLFEVVPDRHVFIATYNCRLMGAFKPAISHGHTQIGCFAPGALPANLPAGYRASIAAACSADV
ncbi:MAG: NUDIX domain-containing protein [Burkholderiaceae bacterium]|jgi:ADP-ribose pyrophosphatase YjhB (NUDIX family)|nr:NUDIX domain-containing protein [Burkholderiaceae bacterium]